MILKKIFDVLQQINVFEKIGRHFAKISCEYDIFENVKGKIGLNKYVDISAISFRQKRSFQLLFKSFKTATIYDFHS